VPAFFIDGCSVVNFSKLDTRVTDYGAEDYWMHWAKIVPATNPDSDGASAAVCFANCTLMGTLMVSSIAQTISRPL
jgi:hypothetical protein